MTAANSAAPLIKALVFTRAKGSESRFWIGFQPLIEIDMVFKALALSITLLIGVGVIMFFNPDRAQAGHLKSQKQRQKHRNYRKYSKKWWRVYRLRMRQRKALSTRKRQLRLRLIRLAQIVPAESPPRPTMVLPPAPEQGRKMRLWLESALVDKIYDGSTIGVKTKDGASYRIKMLGAAAPGARESFGRRSRELLKDLILGREVTIVLRRKISDDLFLGTIYYGGGDINLKQIENGMARYINREDNAPTESDRLLYDRAEQKARREGVGLWSLVMTKKEISSSRIKATVRNCQPREKSLQEAVETLK